MVKSPIKDPATPQPGYCPASFQSQSQSGLNKSCRVTQLTPMANPPLSLKLMTAHPNWLSAESPMATRYSPLKNPPKLSLIVKL